MHKVRRVLRIKFRFAYSFLILGIGIGIALIIVFFLLESRIVSNQTKEEIFPDHALFSTNQIIVKYKTEFNPEKLSKTKQEDLNVKLAAIGVKSQRRLFISQNPLLENYYILELPENSDIPKFYTLLSKIEEIDAVTPDYILQVQEVPNDPYFPVLWGLEKVHAQKAWDIIRGSNVIVAIVDTGVDLNHEDLRQNIVKGINTVEDSDDPSDDHGHGTHVAGTVGAVTNNEIGISSISWGTKLLAIKSCDQNGDCKTSDVAKGIQYAVDHGAKVVNVSVAGEGSCRGTYNDVITYATQKGALLVVAAGNGISGKGVDAKKWIPASCPGIFTVGAVGPDGGVAPYSNYGDVVSVSAPGGDRGAGACSEETCILSTNTDSTYSLRQGTSMAAPHVSGAAALLLSYNPDLSIAELKSCLSNGDIIPGDNKIGKLLNIEKALNLCTPTITKTPVQETGDLSISGRVFIDTNRNKVFDQNENVLPGVQVLLSGFAQKSVVSNDTGRFIFPKLESGFYTLSMVVFGKDSGGIYDVSLQSRFPHVQIDLPVLPDLIPKLTSSPEPIQIDDSRVQCVPDPACEEGNGGIQICTLKCK